MEQLRRIITYNYECSPMCCPLVETSESFYNCSKMQANIKTGCVIWWRYVNCSIWK